MQASQLQRSCRASVARSCCPRLIAARSVSVSADVTTETKIQHIGPSNYTSFLEEHADKLVLVDFYTDWCGPCKMIAPELEKMAAENDPSKVLVAKMNCGVDNDSKKLAMQLQIKALPTFKFYKNGQVVETMTGNKPQALRDAIAKHLQ